MPWFETKHPTSGERLEVEWITRPPRKGRRDRYGAPEEPDHPGETEIVRVITRPGKAIDYTPIEAILYHEIAKRFAEADAGGHFSKKQTWRSGKYPVE